MRLKPASHCKSETCHLSGEILEDGGAVDGGGGANSSRGGGSGLQVPMDPEHDEDGEDDDGYVDDYYGQVVVEQLAP